MNARIMFENIGYVYSEDNLIGEIYYEKGDKLITFATDHCNIYLCGFHMIGDRELYCMFEQARELGWYEFEQKMGYIL